MGTESKLGATTGAAPEGAESGFEIELVNEPAVNMPRERAEALNEEMADLGFRICGGIPEGHPDEEMVRAGWRAYCTVEGGRAQDYSRLVLVWQDGRLVGFSGGVVAKLEPDVTLLWYKAAGTDPTLQSHGAFAKAREAMGDLEWLFSHGKPSYFVMRTPNPAIYDVSRRWWGKLPGALDRFYPMIGPDGQMEPLDAETQEIGSRIAAAMFPGIEYEPDTLVLRNFLGEYGHDIWRVGIPEYPDPGTTKWFEQNLRPNNQDALMNFCLFNV